MFVGSVFDIEFSSVKDEVAVTGSRHPLGEVFVALSVVFLVCNNFLYFLLLWLEHLSLSGDCLGSCYGNAHLPPSHSC